MKKIAILFLILTLCISMVSCSYFESGKSSGVKENAGAKKEDSKTSTTVTYPVVSSKPSQPTYTVYFDSQGGTHVSPCKVKVLEDAPYSTRPDHVFCGWYRDQGLVTPAIFPMEVTADTTLYAKWLRTSATFNCKGTFIKDMDKEIYDGVYYNMTHAQFDYAALAAAGYTVKIDVTYDVHYKKDYDVLWDIGYAGAPRYNVSILADGIGTVQKNLQATTCTHTKSISFSTSAVDFLKMDVYLNFSTENIQNIIYFDNINVKITCYK